MSSGINLSYMDLSIHPGDDFFDFATSGWRTANPIPDDFAEFGTFQKLRIQTNEQIRNLVQDIARRDRNSKIAVFYNMAMDTDALNTAGTAPVQPIIDKIRDADCGDMAALLGQLHTFISPFWGNFVSPGMNDSSVNRFNLNQGGIGLPERDFYFADAHENIRKAYIKYIERIMNHFGIDADAGAIFELEKNLAEAHRTKEMMRDRTLWNNEFTFEDFKRRFPGLDWDAYFDARGRVPAVINVQVPDALDRALDIINNTDIEIVRAYIKRVLATRAASFVDDDAFEINFDFFARTMSGTPLPRPRWERVLGVMDSAMGEYIGREYVARYFPPKAKARMENLVEYLRDAFREHIKATDWMDDETRTEALKKLDSFSAKIGYPDKWRDFTDLEVLPDSYWNNFMRAAIFNDAYELARIDQPVERGRWLMSPQTVNAYYWSATNEICFPAGILQPPFFDMNADDAWNFGAIGAVIAHEMTHGFDDSGRKFDYDGNLRDWWTAESADAFNERAQVMRRHFDAIEVLPGLFANGEFSLGETLADLGGVVLAYTALQNFMNKNPLPDKDGFTPSQRFFIAWATVWANNSREEELRRRVASVPHPNGRWRTNGILPHFDAWYNAFGITSEHKLYLPKDMRARIW
ncbi:MAG: M13 family metallopeptidase [Alphaproteobacteria bacterium]|nr:M13 family metallopeptidase [Alphaproteobacteria bacterium]